MAKSPREILDRQVIQNFRTSGDSQHIQTVLPESAASGEIIVQLADPASGTSLWTLAKDGQTAVQFVNKETVDYLISQGPSAQVTELSGATVALSGETVRIDTELQGLSSHTLSEIERIDESISAVSGYVVDYVKEVSGDIETTINALSAGTEAAISELSGSVHSTIDAMDKEASAEPGKVLTTVAQADGKVSETKADVINLALCGYTKTNDTGAIADGDSIEVALSKLENVSNANAITNDDHSINVTSSATGTVIDVNIKSDEKVVLLGNDGLYTDLDLVKITTGLPETVKERYQLLASDDTQIGANIDIAKDSHIVSITYISDPSDAHYQNLEYKYIDVEGEEQTEYVDMSQLVLEAEFASGVTITNHVAHGVVDPTSESFLTVGADGFKLAGVQDAIDGAIDALDAGVSGKSSDNRVEVRIEEVDGKLTNAEVLISDLASASALTELSGSVISLSGAVQDVVSNLDATVSDGSQAEHVSIEIAQADGLLSGVVLTTYDIASAQDLSDLSGATVAEIARAQAAEGEIAGLVGLTGDEGSREWDADGAYLTGSTVKDDMELLDDVLGSTTSTTFDSTNTVAKNIDDIKADLEAFKNKLALSGKENPYAKVTVVSADTGTSIEVSAKTQEIATATAATNGLADAYDVRTFAVSDVKGGGAEQAGGYTQANAGVKVESESDGDKVLDFTNLKVDCGEF